MTREERDEIIWLYAAGALSEAEVQSARALLEEGDAEDLASLTAARETLARLPEALDEVEPSDDVLDRLMKRVDPERAGSAYVAPRRSARRWVWPLVFSAAAACVAIASVITARNLMLDNERMQTQLDQATSELERRRQQSALELAAAQTELESLRAATARQVDEIKAYSTNLANATKQVQQLIAQNRLLYASNVQFTSLEGKNLPKGGGRVIWDMENRKSHVFVFDLAPLPQGKVYELWLIEPNKPAAPAGTFTVDAQGTAQLVSDIPANLENVQIAAITIEDAPGVQVSQQQPILVGSRTPTP